MHPRPSPTRLSPSVLVRVEGSFAEVNLRQQFLLPTASCVFAIRWEIPRRGTRSRIALESKNQSIEYADRASSQELVFVSSLLGAIQFPCKHFEKSYEGMILRQASRFAQSKPFVQRDSWMSYCVSNSACRTVHGTDHVPLPSSSPRRGAQLKATNVAFA